jgi:hypothetical protein
MTVNAKSAAMTKFAERRGTGIFKLPCLRISDPALSVHHHQGNHNRRHEKHRADDEICGMSRTCLGFHSSHT